MRDVPQADPTEGNQENLDGEPAAKAENRVKNDKQSATDKDVNAYSEYGRSH